MSYQPSESIVSIIDTLSQTRRPRLLLRTARIGMREYRRETDLKRVLRLPAAPPPGPQTVRALIELEAQLETQRLRPAHGIGDTWRPARHVEVMIALMAESQHMAEAISTPPQPARRLTLVRAK